MIELFDLSTEDATPFLNMITAEGQRFLSGDAGAAVGISEEGKPVGAIVCEISDAFLARIVSLFVKEDRRRKGFGTELVYQALNLLLRKESICRLDVRFTSDSENPGIYEFFDAMSFSMSQDETHGAYSLSLLDAGEVPVLKKASSQGITPYARVTRPVKNKIFEAHPMLLRCEIEESISCVADAGKDDVESHDCLIFTKEDNTLVMVWAESTNDKLDLVKMLKYALDKAVEKYGTDISVRIPYINEASKKLIIKMMGEKAVHTESVWDAELSVMV